MNKVEAREEVDQRIEEEVMSPWESHLGLPPSAERRPSLKLPTGARKLPALLDGRRDKVWAVTMVMQEKCGNRMPVGSGKIADEETGRRSVCHSSTATPKTPKIRHELQPPSSQYRPTTKGALLWTCPAMGLTQTDPSGGARQLLPPILSRSLGAFACEDDD